ncbi:uncharacterized protein LOC107849066 [Capsicum annuum]|uniref:uncharacterized protein LOC107849066 n=1 Tax=Capsicum annuum TaxID=4072 RepID=UPI0007BF4950|nr:uncharacterized protein LOC107849066 [Capsicum annuum]
MEFTKALYDLRASVNFMPLTIYKNLGLGNPTPTNMRLVMADRSVKRPVGILYNMLVKVSNFIFPTDFVILDCEVDFEVNDKEEQFDMGKSVKQHEKMCVLLVVDVYFEEEQDMVKTE